MPSEFEEIFENFFEFNETVGNRNETFRFRTSQSDDGNLTCCLAHESVEPTPCFLPGRGIGAFRLKDLDFA